MTRFCTLYYLKNENKIWNIVLICTFSSALFLVIFYFQTIFIIPMNIHSFYYFDGMWVQLSWKIPYGHRPLLLCCLIWQSLIIVFRVNLCSPFPTFPSAFSYIFYLVIIFFLFYFVVFINTLKLPKIYQKAKEWKIKKHRKTLY